MLYSGDILDTYLPKTKILHVEVLSDDVFRGHACHIYQHLARTLHVEVLSDDVIRERT